MNRSTEITTLFLDVGGVLLTNGWGHQSRALAAKTFDLNLEEMEDRHHLTFDTYEVGKLTLEEYLTGRCSTRSGRSRGTSSGNSCSRSRNLIPR